jgi:D-3-phosphoglycerate dehydrogenase
MKIVVLEPLGIPEKDIRSIAKKTVNGEHELILYNDKTADVEVLKDRVKDANVLVIANMLLKGEVINSAEKLKMISIAFTGVDHVDLKVCREKNILVSNAAGYSTNSVAELAFGLIISLLRNIVVLDEVTRNGGTKDGYGQNDLYGKTLGVIGTGAIGKKVAEIGLAFGCHVIAFNRSENKDLISKGVKYVDLEDIFKESDIVTIHLPLTDSTRGIVNNDRLNLMKKNSILINTARGPLVDNEALANILHEGKISGAGIDVFDMEPPLPFEYSLLKENRVILTPHIGFATEEAMIRRAKIVFENISGWIEGNPQNVI